MKPLLLTLTLTSLLVCTPVARAEVTVVREYEPTAEELNEPPDTDSGPDEECLELNAPAICSEVPEGATTQGTALEGTSNPPQSYPQYSAPSDSKQRTVKGGGRKMKQRTRRKKKSHKRKDKDGRR